MHLAVRVRQSGYAEAERALDDLDLVYQRRLRQRWAAFLVDHYLHEARLHWRHI